MKKRDMTKIALMGLTSGLLISSQANAAQGANSEIQQSLLAANCRSQGGCSTYNTHSCSSYNSQNGCSSYSPHNGCSSYTADREINPRRTLADTSDQSTKNQTKLMTEDELKAQLNAEGRDLYDSLDSKGKTLAIELASRACKGFNSCKGLNACKTAKNDCKGKGECKGQSTCKFTNKNDAVKIAAKKMAEKRSSMMNQ